MRSTHPVRLLAVTALVIFLGEGLIMWLFHVLAPLSARLSPMQEGLLDACLLTLGVFPVLYRTLLHPLRQEVAQRTQAEEALRQACGTLEAQVEQRTQELSTAHASLQAVMDTAHDAIICADQQGLVTYWNRHAGRLFGYAADEIIGQSLTRLMPERFQSAHTAGVQRVVAGGAPHTVGKTVELTGLRKDGQEFPIELSLAQGNIHGKLFFTAIIRDIRARKQAEAALQESNRQLASINSVMLDREERMLEMKREVNALLQELGRPAQY